jgi:hypothetical protein
MTLLLLSSEDPFFSLLRILDPARLSFPCRKSFFQIRRMLLLLFVALLSFRGKEEKEKEEGERGDFLGGEANGKSSIKIRV